MVAERAETVEPPRAAAQLLGLSNAVLDHEVLGERPRHRDDDAYRRAAGAGGDRRTEPAIGDVHPALHQRLDRAHPAMDRGPGGLQPLVAPQPEIGRGRAGEVVDAEGLAGAGGEADGNGIGHVNLLLGDDGRNGGW